MSYQSAERLALDLMRACVSGRERDVVLTAVATAQALLGMPQELYQPTLVYLSNGVERLKALRTVWESMAAEWPYLVHNINPLVGWIDNPSESELRDSDRCFAKLSTIDVPKMVTDCQGDWLGQMYTFTLSASGQKAGGKFYTPMHVGRLMAQLSGLPEPFSSVNDPCCGTGGLILATVFEMREAGRLPELVHWVLNDIDPIAVALCGVNLASRGVPNVTLTCSNALAPPPEPSPFKIGDTP